MAGFNLDVARLLLDVSEENGRSSFRGRTPYGELVLVDGAGWVFRFSDRERFPVDVAALAEIDSPLEWLSILGPAPRPTELAPMTRSVPTSRESLGEPVVPQQPERVLLDLPFGWGKIALPPIFRQ